MDQWSKLLRPPENFYGDASDTLAKPVPGKYMMPGSVNVGFICIYLCVDNGKKNDPILLAVTTDVRIYQLTTFR